MKKVTKMVLDEGKVCEAIIYGTLDDVKQFPLDQLKTHISSSSYVVKNKTFKKITPLFLAVLSHRIEIIQYMLENSFPVNSLVNGTTVLHLSCFLNYSDIVELLLFYGANPLAIDENLMDPLSVAVTYGYNDVIEILLHYDYPPQGLSLSLQIAIFNNNIELVNTLMLHGADPNLENVSKKKPIDVVKKEQVEITNLLLNCKPYPKIGKENTEERMQFFKEGDSLSTLVEDISYNFKAKEVNLHKVVMRSLDLEEK